LLIPGLVDALGRPSAHFGVHSLRADYCCSFGKCRTEGEEDMRRALTAVICALAFAGASASGALAGEVTGPPGSAANPPTNATGAPEHSNSICSFNGLNDFNQGPTIERTQTPANQGVPGEAGADAAGSGTPGHPSCGGGSNFSRGIPR
jgi:hypothetical protein